MGQAFLWHLRVQWMIQYEDFQEFKESTELGFLDWARLFLVQILSSLVYEPIRGQMVMLEDCSLLKVFCKLHGFRIDFLQTQRTINDRLQALLGQSLWLYLLLWLESSCSNPHLIGLTRTFEVLLSLHSHTQLSQTPQNQILHLHFALKFPDQWLRSKVLLVFLLQQQYL